MSTCSRRWMPRRKLSQSMESRSTWSRSRTSSRMSSGSTSGAIVVSTDSTTVRVSSLVVVICTSLFQEVGLLEQLVDCGEEQRAPVTITCSMVGGERGLHSGDVPDSAVDSADSLGGAAETDDGYLWRVDNAEDRIDDLVTEIGHRDGRVGHLRTPQGERACPRHEIGEIVHQFVQLLVRDVMYGRRDETTTAQGYPDTDMNSGRGLEAVVSPESVELGEALCGDADGLQQQDGRQYPLIDGSLRISRRQPGQRVFQNDFVSEVVMRNLPLGPAHRGRDRLSHLNRTFGRGRLGFWFRGWCPGWFLGGCDVLEDGGGVLDVADDDRPLRTGAAHRVDIDMETLGQAASGR